MHFSIAAVFGLVGLLHATSAIKMLRTGKSDLLAVAVIALSATFLTITHGIWLVAADLPMHKGDISDPTVKVLLFFLLNVDHFGLVLAVYMGLMFSFGKEKLKSSRRSGSSSRISPDPTVALEDTDGIDGSGIAPVDMRPR